jgi:hypothetical protein
MVEDESELFLFGPIVPPFRLLTGSFIYRPDIGITSPLQENDLAPDLNLKPPRDEGFKLVIDSVG